MLFYLLITLILLAAIALFFYQRRQKKPRMIRKAPQVSVESGDQKDDSESGKEGSESPYDPNLVILQLNAFPGKPYMGYELYQALLSVDLRLGEDNIFHRYDDGGEKVLFSLAAATSRGAFVAEKIGSFRCNGLLLFMRLDPKRKLMASFDLMLDAARQLTEELGGDIYDDLQNLISADAIKRLREKICTVETKNLYTSDLLDNLD